MRNERTAAHPERVRTDQSLTEERERSNNEITKARALTEREADAVLELAQARASSLLESARAAANHKLEDAAILPNAVKVLAEERDREDAVLEMERETASDARHDERKRQQRALAILLRLEREATDSQLLLERARADEVVATRDTFLGMVSHDLRTIVTAISMHAALMIREPAASSRDRSVSGAEKIQRLAARMNRLIGDLIDVTSIEAGKLAVDAARQEASDLVKAAVDAFEPAAAAKGISIDSVMEGDSVLAEFDAERVLQVLSNLLSNAIKFTAQGGRVTVRVESKATVVQFSVTDSGCGFRPEDGEAVFERFWQSNTRDRRGLGLGLYISKCIIDAHGGKIWAETRPGQGSSFHFTLPSSQAAEIPTP
jgi:signal transduction histidine kinase